MFAGIMVGMIGLALLILGRMIWKKYKNSLLVQLSL